MVHTWKETGEVPKGRMGLTLAKKIKATGINREELWADGLHEVPMAYNVISGQTEALVLPVSSEEKDAWKAEHGDEWVTGTADYVGILLELPWVDDLKTGRHAEYESYKYQQAFYTLVWTLFQAKGLTPARSTITHWPKYRLDTPPSRYGTMLEPEFFLDFQGKLRKLHEDVNRYKENEMENEVSGLLIEGSQCMYCPSKLNCIKGQKYERNHV